MFSCSSSSFYSTTGSVFIMKYVAIIFSLLFIFSCNRNTTEYIDISSTLGLAMSPQWAVITEPYASYFSDANEKSIINEYGRVGDVIEVIGSKIGENEFVWYKFEQGWLIQNTVQVYANKLQADFAAKEIQ